MSKTPDQIRVDQLRQELRNAKQEIANLKQKRLVSLVACKDLLQAFIVYFGPKSTKGRELQRELDDLERVIADEQVYSA